MNLSFSSSFESLFQDLQSTMSSKEANQNLYLQDFTIPQIDLYNLISEHLPTVAMTTKIAIESLINLIEEDQEDLSLIDLGMGTGQQMLKVLDALKSRRPSLKQVFLVGIEPDERSLKMAQAQLINLELPFELELRIYHSLLENLSKKDFESMYQFIKNPIIWSSFTMHHVMTNRAEEFEKINDELKPSYLILLEPNVDHFTSNYSQRIKNCQAHFKKTFDLIEKLHLKDIEKENLKKFFTREIIDISSADEKARVEKHQTVKEWLGYLDAAGFIPINHEMIFKNKYIHIEPKGDHYSLEYQNFPLTAVVCAKAI